MIEQLKELFLRPGTAVLRTQIIENQQWCVAHLFKKLVIADVAVGTEGGTQVIEQIGHDHEQRRLAGCGACGGNGRGQVRLAATV